MNVNQWFLSLAPERQAVLREDKWMLAEAASQAATELEREACAQMCEDRAALEQTKAGQALTRGDQPLWAMYSSNADQNTQMAKEIRARKQPKENHAK